MAQDDEQPILIRKKRKAHAGHKHHGGAWKVAYADFVTAMMAFFLLLWLITTTNDEQKKGLADYFSPVTVARSTQSGSDGMLGGKTITSDGAMVSSQTPFGITVNLPADSYPDSDSVEEPSEGDEIPAAEEYAEGEESPVDEKGSLSDVPPGERELALSEDRQPGTGRAENKQEALEVTREELARLEEIKAEQDFEAAVQQLRKVIQSTPELADLADNLLVDRTPEGMRLQLIDQQGTSMFQRGSAIPEEHTRKLFALISQTLATLPNRIAIKGHTDATPYRGDGSYSNWELSSDRALASRRALLEAGLPAGRIADVIGKADTDPLIVSDPTDPQNRRISIILLDEPAVASTVRAQALPDLTLEATPMTTPVTIPEAASESTAAPAPVSAPVSPPAAVAPASPQRSPGEPSPIRSAPSDPSSSPALPSAALPSADGGSVVPGPSSALGAAQRAADLAER